MMQGILFFQITGNLPEYLFLMPFLLIQID